MFKGFHNPTTELLNNAWASENTLFAFDTNVFLNLYGYEEQTRTDFFDVLKELGDRVWIPYHVGLEYQRRRLEVMRDEKAVFSKLNDLLDKIDKIFDNDFNELALKRRFPKLNENTEKLRHDAKKNIRDYRKSVDYWDKKQPCVRSHDKIRAVINEIFQGKVGSPPIDQEWLNKLYKEGEVRYKNNVAPGFKDAVKAKASDNTFSYNKLTYERQYGDLILWKQLINKANDEVIKNVIFITDDIKEDWWYILDSRGKKQVGPHANLQNEIYSESDIEVFHMYNTSQFLKDGKVHLRLGVHESSIDDARFQFYESLENRKIEQEKALSAFDFFRETELFSNKNFGYLYDKKLLEDVVKSEQLENDYLKQMKEERKKKEKFMSNYFERIRGKATDTDDEM